MTVRRRQDTNRWQARYRGPDGKERARDFNTKREATIWRQEELSKIRRAEWTDPRSAQITLGQMWEPWLASLSIKPKTLAGYESLWRTCVAPQWSSVKLQQVTPLAVRTWVANTVGEKGAPLSASRKRQAFNVLAGILDAAVRDGRLARNPARSSSGTRNGFLPPIQSTRRRRFLDHAEVLALAEATGDYSTLILVLCTCGLRWGEASALRVRDVDLLRNRLHVEQSLAEVNGKLLFGLPKTHQIREVSIPKFLVDPLMQQMLGKGPDDLLFTAPSGTPLRSQNFRRRVFIPALRKAQIAPLRIHDLRHTAAGLAVNAGANVKGVQRMLGHADASMTLNVYADLFDGHLDEVADRLDEAFSRANADSVRTETVRALRR